MMALKFKAHVGRGAEIQWKGVEGERGGVDGGEGVQKEH
jgi:hypothetical protein